MKQAFVKILFFAGSNLYLFGQVPNDVDILAPSGVPAAGPLEENASEPKQIRSSQAETVRKAGEDVRFGKEGARVGAAKLLGKYPGSLSATMLHCSRKATRIDPASFLRITVHRLHHT